MTTLLVLYTLALTQAGASDDGGWEQFHREDGITLWRRETPESSFVTFRGRGPVEVPIDRVAAVLRATNRNREWMADCVAGNTVRYLSVMDSVIYHRTASPVPFISDRDTVLKAASTVDFERRTITIAFSRTRDSLQPPVEGVVRMPSVSGHWKMFALDATTTEVEYQVQADPGGSIPSWVVNLVSKKLPFRTIQGLRRQVAADGYDHHLEMVRLAIDWTPVGSDTSTVGALRVPSVQ